MSNTESKEQAPAHPVECGVMPTGAWTSEKPTEEGWFWYYYPDGDYFFPVRVVFVRDAETCGWKIVGAHISYEDHDGLWCGPIETPPPPHEQ